MEPLKQTWLVLTRYPYQKIKLGLYWSSGETQAYTAGGRASSGEWTRILHASQHGQKIGGKKGINWSLSSPYTKKSDSEIYISIKDKTLILK